MALDIDATRAQLSDSKASKRAAACKKLGKAIASDSKCATPALLEDLAARTRDRSDPVSMAACAALVAAGSASVDLLVDMLQLERLPTTEAEVTDDDSIAHTNISQALGELGDARAIPALFAVAASVSRGNTGAICGLGELAKQRGDVAQPPLRR